MFCKKKTKKERINFVFCSLDSHLSRYFQAGACAALVMYFHYCTNNLTLYLRMEAELQTYKKINDKTALHIA